MATRYFKSTGTAWNTANDWASTVGGVDNAGVPTSGDDVIFDNSSGSCSLITTGAACRSFDQGTGATKYAGTFSGNVGLTIGNNTAPPSGILIRLSSTCVWTHAATVATSGNHGSTTVTVTMAGISWGQQFNVSSSSGATVQHLDAVTAVGAINKTSAGNYDLNGQTMTTPQFAPSGSSGTITLGSATLNLSLSGDAWQCSNASGVTISAASSTINFTGNTANLRHGDGGNGNATFGTVNFNPSGTGTFSGNINNGATSVLTFATLTFVGFASKTYAMAVKNPITVNTALKFAGNSATNRPLVSSFVVGTAVAITLGASATCRTAGTQNVDFMDITLSGGAANERDLSAITGNSGDAQGNSGITFTPSATQTSTGTASFTWSTHGWTSRVPLPQDDVSVPNAFIAGRVITSDMPRLGRTITFTCTGSPTLSNSGNWSNFGSFTLATGMTVSGTNTMTFGGRLSYTITSNSVSWTQGLIVNAPSGTYTLQDPLTCSRSAAGALTVTSGTLVDNGQTVTLSGVNGAYAQTNGTATLTGTWNFSTTGAVTFWSQTGGTTTGTGSTITLTGATTNTRTFAGGGQTYGTLTYTVANSPGALTVTGANTFTTVNIGSGRVVNMPASTTTTDNTASGFNFVGAYNGYVYLPGVSGVYATAPDTAALSITGDIDIRVRLTMDDWTPASFAAICGKWPTAQGQFQYLLEVDATSTGKLNFYKSSNGTVSDSVTSSVGNSFVDGAIGWIRVTYSSSSGNVLFYTSSTATNDPTAVTWTQLGTTRSVSASAIFDGNVVLGIGGMASTGIEPLSGKVYRAAIYSTIAGSTPAFDADFTSKPVGASTFTELSANAATVTMNGDMAICGDGSIVLQSSSGGTAATLSSTQTQNWYWCRVKDITASGGGTFNAYSSVNVSGNTSVTFTARKTPVSVGGNWSATTTWLGAVVPLASDNVCFAPASGNVTIDASSVCRSLDCQDGSGNFAGTLTMSANLGIGDATAGIGNRVMRLASGMTWTQTAGNLSFLTTSATQQTIDTASVSLGGTTLSFNGTGQNLLLSSSMTCGTWGNISNAAAFNTNGQSINCTSFSSTNASSTLTCGASVITSTGAITVTVATFNANTSEFKMTGAGTVTFTGTGKTFYKVTRIGTAVKTDVLSIAGNFTVTNTFSVGGNAVAGSNGNRVLVQSSTLGTSRQITMTGATFTMTGDADFSDINVTGAPTFTNASSCFVGDAQGNSTYLTCTTDGGTNGTARTTQTSTGTASFTWSTHGWTSRVPLPQDDVSIPNSFIAGRTITADMPRLGRTITCTCTGSPSFAFTGTTPAIFGSFTLVSGMNTTGSSSRPVLAGRSTYNYDPASVTLIQGVTVNAPGGTYTQQNDVTYGLNNAACFVTAGTLDTNGKTVTFTTTQGTVNVNGGTLTTGSSTFNIGVTSSVSVWNISSGTVNGTGSTIVLTGATTNTRSINSSGQTLGTLTYTVANSPGILSVTGSNTWAGTWNIGPGRIVQCASGATQTFTAANGLGGVAGSNQGYLYVGGANTGNAEISTPDTAALSITGDIDLRARVALDNWIPGSIQTLVAKFTASNSYAFVVTNSGGTGRLGLYLSSNGIDSPNTISTVGYSFTNGTTQWVRVTWRQSDHRVQFFTASGAIANPVASDFSLLGADSSIVTASIFDSTSVVTVCNNNGSNFLAGKMYRAQIRNGLDGTLVYDADFTTKAFGVNTFTESSSNAATVTINGALAQAGDGRVVLQAASGTTTLATTGGSTMTYTMPDHILATPSGAVYVLDGVDGGSNTGIVFSPPDELPQKLVNEQRAFVPAGNTRSVIRAGRY